MPSADNRVRLGAAFEVGELACFARTGCEAGCWAGDCKRRVGGFDRCVGVLVRGGVGSVALD